MSLWTPECDRELVSSGLIYYRRVIKLVPGEDGRRIEELFRFDKLYVSPLESTADLEKVYISVSDLEPIPAKTLVNGLELGVMGPSSIGPRLVNLPLSRKVIITWEESENHKTITLLFSGEGIARINTPQATVEIQPSSIRSFRVALDNSGGSLDLVSQLFTAQTLSRSSLVKRVASGFGDDLSIYIGDSSIQEYPLDVGEVLKTSIRDLSVIYVRVPPGILADLRVVLEV